jgi:hypothetical protein
MVVSIKNAINFQTYAASLVARVFFAEQELDRHLHPPVQKLEKDEAMRALEPLIRPGFDEE